MPSLRAVTGGAAMESPETLRALAGTLPGVEFCGIYGSTEAGCWVTRTTAEQELTRPGTIGRPLPSFDAVVLGGDDEILPPGQPGELGLRGPSLMSSYWHLPDATAEAFRCDWLHTGDVVRTDEDGYLYFVGRSKDMVKPGGENVYAAEVERVLLEHPEVRECAVIGVPDPRWGEGVKAVVVIDGSCGPEQLDLWCLERMAAFKRPRWYEFLPVLPRTQMGKVMKDRLRQEHDTGRCVRLRERDGGPDRHARS
jgi:acyl-CoA synthetase (AMP-forming)/AMP-acid ligase II